MKLHTLLIAVSFTITCGAMAQTPVFTIQQNMEARRYYADSTARMPVLNSNRTFANNKDSIGQYWMRIDSAKMFIRLPGNVIKAVATEDSLRFGSTYIRNQYAAGQVADFAITGNGAVQKMTAYNSVTATYSRFISLATDAVDTTKQLWSIGIVGSPGGSPIHAGGTLVFRSYNTAGSVLSDRVSILRNGVVVMPGGITAGTGSASFGASSSGVSASGAITTENSIGAVGGVINGGLLREWTTTTITGDYTISGTELYINVNNTADCTITIPAALSTVPGKGRVLYIKKTINNAFNVNIVVAGGAQTIDGAATLTTNTFNQSYHLHDDGSNWFTY